jgi:hypothetical protein
MLIVAKNWCSLGQIKAKSTSHHKISGMSSSRARTYAVLTPRATLDALDLTKAKIQQIANVNPEKIDLVKVRVPIKADWAPTQKIVIKTISESINIPDEEPVHLFFGGLPALMAAAKMKTKYPERNLLFINNGILSKSEQSGHQAHNHPSEFVAEDCNKRNLIKTMARGLGIISSPDPTDIENYSYLHFQNVAKQFLEKPNQSLQLYISFFIQRILHDINSKNGVSAQDRWLCRTIEKSLDFHEMLSDKIAAKTGLRTLKRDFRIYWSHDHKGIAKKEVTWKELGIPCEMISESDLIKRTLLRLDRNLAVLKILRDGQFEPETPKRVIEYFSNEYSDTFKVLKGEVNEIYINPYTQQPEAIKVTNNNGERIIPVKSVFGTPGHDQVFKYNSLKGTEKQLWKSVPVSGISSFWICTIPRKELEKRWQTKEGEDAELISHLTKICPAANLCNLHVTVFDYEIRYENVRLYVRVSQGANFNSTMADKNDLVNIATNLDKFFIGDWTLLSAGTCTRQTGVTNIPTVSGMFGYDYSGVGYSASVPPDEDDPKPLLF